MCGFAAMIRFDGGPIETDVLRHMAASIVHRGPDDSGEYVAEGVGFAFRRLSILDLSPSGHQPMATSDGRFTIVFNGEIYNFRELRRELEAMGHTFRSTGDTEVLLRAYAHWGTDCLPRLNGMWAFLIHDRARGVVFGARDRFGIKPLFLWRERTQLLAASELKAIRASRQYTADQLGGGSRLSVGGTPRCRSRDVLRWHRTPPGRARLRAHPRRPLPPVALLADSAGEAVAGPRSGLGVRRVVRRRSPPAHAQRRPGWRAPFRWTRLDVHHLRGRQDRCRSCGVVTPARQF